MVASFVDPMAFMASFFTGAMGAVPIPETMVRVSKPSSFSLYTAVSTHRPATWMDPTSEAVGATTAQVFAGSTPQSFAIFSRTSPLGR